MLDNIPERVIDLMAAGIVAEYATITKDGIPLDTPCYYFPSEGLRTFDLATGLSYPAKAERARRDPKVGLLIEGAADEPVISIAGMAAVRDADPQANALRYLSEVAYFIPGNPTWEVARKAVYYWTRIIIEVTPVRILWWENRAAMEGPPHIWSAPPDTVYPASDPAAPGAVSAPAKWQPRPWKETADHAISRKAPAHLTLIDDDGYPLSIRVLKALHVEEGFDLIVPEGAPWSGTGNASLSFEGLEVFVGAARKANGRIHMRVDRALPFHPLMNDSREMFAPSPETYNTLMRRLEHETDRRGVPIPIIPATKPALTNGAKLRAARFKVLSEANNAS